MQTPISSYLDVTLTNPCGYVHTHTLSLALSLSLSLSHTLSRSLSMRRTAQSNAQGIQVNSEERVQTWQLILAFVFQVFEYSPSSQVGQSHQQTESPTSPSNKPFERALQRRTLALDNVRQYCGTALESKRDARMAFANAMIV